MAQYALGIKIVEFWPKAKDGVPGYAVKYEDGYISWSPKPIFERHYMPMGLDPSKVSEQMVDQMLYSAIHQTLPDRKTLLTTAELATGFNQYETSSCVDPSNYDATIGESLNLKKVRQTIWKCLGFAVQWARYGLKHKEMRDYYSTM